MVVKYARRVDDLANDLYQTVMYCVCPTLPGQIPLLGGKSYIRRLRRLNRCWLKDPEVAQKSTQRLRDGYGYLTPKKLYSTVPLGL